MQKLSSYIVLFLFASVLAAQTPFSCDGKMYFFRSDPNTPNGVLAYFDNYTTATTVTNLCPLPTNAHNGLAANPLNNMLYYLEGQNLRSLDANCNSTIVCPSIGFSSLAGACDNYGRYWTINTAGLVAVDINTCTVVKGPFTGFAGALDIAYNLYDCHIYVNSGSTLIMVDTNGVTQNTYSLTFTPSGTYGGTAFGSNGLLYGVAGQNSNGNLSVIDINNLTTNLVTNFTDGPTFARSDMASFACVNVDAYLTATPISGCAPLNVQFTDTSMAYPGPVNYWSWDFGDGSPLSSVQNPNHTYTSPGTYTVILIVGTTTGCNLNDFDTTTTVITVTNGPNATVSQPISFCTGGSATLTATGGGNYLWSTGATTASITVSPTTTTIYSVTVSQGSCSSTITTTVTVFPIPVVTATGASVCQGDVALLSATGASTYLWSNGATTSSITVTATATTTYTITGTSSDGCTATATATVTVNALPIITASDAQTCSGGTVILSATGGTTYLWSTGATTSSITITATATATYTVTGTNANGCTATATATATVFSAPTAAFNTDPSDLEPGVQTVQFISTSTGATTWFWNFGDGNTSTLENPQHIYSQSGIYLVWLVVTNANGCTDSISMTVEIRPDWSIYLPNAFTPDGNGTNEIFYAYGTNILEFEMWIFDRWGKLIFTSTDMHKGWDGKVQDGNSDALVQEDVYVWKVVITDHERKEHRLVGSVTVVR